MIWINPHTPSEPITRSKVKALKEALNGLVVQVLARAELGDLLKHQKNVLVYLIHVQEGLDHSYLSHEVSTISVKPGEK